MLFLLIDEGARTCATKKKKNTYTHGKQRD